MKRKLSILFISFASILFLVAGILPHHHHKGMTCIITDACDLENSINEEHCHHHPSDDTDHHNHHCLTHTKFIVFTDDESRYNVCSCNYFVFTHLYPIDYLFADFLIYNELIAENRYEKLILFYKSPDTSHNYGLRAPPFF